MIGPSPDLDAAGLPAGYPFKPDVELTPRAVKAALDRRDGSLVLIDCRRVEEWDTARIPGAALFPLDQIVARVDEIADLIQRDGGLIAVHCHHGVRSLKAALALRYFGVNAWSVAGGIDLWSIDIDPRIPRY